MSFTRQKKYPYQMEVDKPMVKIGFISFLIAGWFVIFKWDSGWYTIIFIAPMTFLVSLILSVVLGLIEGLLGWLNK